MTQNEIISHTITFVKETLSDNESGHDWWHIYRVYILSKEIAKHEQADIFIVELGALLHDIADSKFHDGDEEVAPKIARDFLKNLSVDELIISKIENIIRSISFKHSFETVKEKSIELAIVQDADRLDAIGAIGIARTFSYGGFKKREMYNPAISPQIYKNSENYKNNTAPTVNHFYEKLFLLKDMMNTDYGKSLAKERHAYMQNYLKQFFAEWDGKK